MTVKSTKLSRVADNVLLPIINLTTGSADLNVNVGFTGTSERVHNGGDSTQWTFSNLTGTGFTESSATHAKEGIATVVDFTALSGVVVVIDGTNITIGTLTEGVDWTAGTSNDATATSLASAINAVAGVSATASGAIITVVADNVSIRADITTFTTTDAVNLPVSAQSIDGTATVNGDEMLLEDITSIDFDNFTTITGNIYITEWRNPGAGKDIELRFRNAGTNVGNSVNLSDFINVATLNEWQAFAISKTIFGINGDVVDELVFKVVDTIGQPAPNFFFDIIQIEESGSPVEFQLFLPVGSTYNLEKIVLTGVSGTVTASGSGTKPFISPNKFFFLNKLPVGLINIITIDSVVIEGAILRDNRNLTNDSGEIINEMWDGTSEGGFAYNFDFGKGVKFIQSRGDKFILRINDDLSGLSFLRMVAVGDLSF